MLGSMADAEDAVQETYLRWHAIDRNRVSDPKAFLMTTTTRICLDMLTSARARHEEYIGPWLPEAVRYARHAGRVQGRMKWLVMSLRYFQATHQYSRVTSRPLEPEMRTNRGICVSSHCRSLQGSSFVW